jgi:hypothetical protein
MRTILVALALVTACGSSSNTGPGKDSKTAAERARLEYEASEDKDLDDEGKAWGGWRYTGSRDECFFVVGRKCFSELAAACKAARCKNGKKGADACKTRGGGPATVICR